MNKEERNQAIQKIQSDVEDIKRDVALIIQHLLVPPFLPGYTPSAPKDIDPYIGATKCQKCGMEFKGVMGYVCADTHCPTFMKPYSGRGVSKITTTGGSWQSYNERTKE
jgi:hypothetical protein